jgi:sterol desaturase/sphingolipid hydroxylase (fatty acid hydroxylase superfamily)
MENPEIVPIPSYNPYRVPPKPESTMIYPRSIGGMIMGIIALILCWFAFIPIAGIVFFIAALLLAILAFTRGVKGMKAITAEPEKYKPISRNFLRTAKVTGLIAMIATPIMFLLSILIMVEEGMFYNAF